MRPRCAIAVVLAAVCWPGGGSIVSQAGGQPLPPNCKLEPGPGPMRCARLDDPNSFYAQNHALFAFVEFPIPGQDQGDPVCLLVRPQQFYSSAVTTYDIPDKASPGFPVLHPYYASIAFTLDYAKRGLTVSELVDRSGKSHALDQNVKLYDVPQSDWPCRLTTWANLLENSVIDVNNVPDRRY
jgi:hypothetical protein